MAQAENLRLQLSPPVRLQLNGEALYPGSVCCSSDGIVMVVFNNHHYTPVTARTLLQVGRIVRGGRVEWRGTPQRYEPDHAGEHPSVSMNNNNVIVEVHESPYRRRLFYRIGVVSVENLTISWGESVIYDTPGVLPAVTVTDELTVLLMHRTSSRSPRDTGYDTYYRIGQVDVEAKQVNWEGRASVASNGRAKTLSVSMNSDETVVETHQSLWRGAVRYRVGIVQRPEGQPLQIDWGRSHDCGSGETPFISINSQGHVIEVHQTRTLRRLKCNSGIADRQSKVIRWSRDESSRYTLGRTPATCLNDRGTVIEIHRSFTGYSLLYQTGTLNYEEQVDTE